MIKALCCAAVLGTTCISVWSQTISVATNPPAAEAKTADDADKKAVEWVASLHLDDASKAARVQAVIATHLQRVRDWNNEHSYTNVPAGINPATGKPLSVLDRQVIMVSAQPKAYHEELMAGLRRDLTEAQVEAILDKYTVGKVEFTLRGYRAIVPDLTPVEETNLLALLKQAREQAVDFKNMKQISAIFEIYKTKCEQYLIANGRNWKELYRNYVRAVKAKKAAANAGKSAPEK